MTIITQLNNTFTPGGGLTILLPSQAEIDLLLQPSLTARWSAHTGYYDDLSWGDDKSGVPCSLRRGALPTVVTGGVKNRQYLQLPSTGATFVAGQGGENLWPSSGEFSFAWVAEPSSPGYQSNQGIICSASPLGGSTAYAGYSNSGKNIWITNGSGLLATSPVPESSATQFVLFSYDYSDGSYALFVNGVQSSAGTGSMTPVETRISLFGAMSKDGPGVSQGGFNGKFYEALIYSAALHKRPSDMSVLNSYMSSVYGLSQ